MYKNLLSKHFLLPILFIFTTTCVIHAQNVRVEVEFLNGTMNTYGYIPGLYPNWGQWGTDCGDCNGNPDPRVYARFKNSSSGSWSGVQSAEQDNVGCGTSVGRTSGSNITLTGVPYTTH